MTVPSIPMFQLPVQPEAWACHAATTIKDAAGQVLAEVSGHGRHSHEDEAIAAEIARRINVHDEVVVSLINMAAWLANTGHAEDHPWRISLRAAIAKATGSAV